MDKIRIRGNNTPLHGEIYVSGSKNAALPAIAASLLTEQELTLTNVPNLRDINSMTELLSQHGAKTQFHGSSNIYGSMNRKLKISAHKITNLTAPYELVRKMRASVWVLGPLLTRFGYAKVSLPGGCAIGTRPINLHLEALQKMGASIEISSGYVEAKAENGLQGAEIIFDIVSVGATINTLMAATLANGKTVIRNAAKEPEICDLSELLNKMGANITGAGTDTITIVGVKKLCGTTHQIIPDRIEAGSYAIAAAITGGELMLNHINYEHIATVVNNLEKAGAKIERGQDWLKVSRPNKINPINLHTAPFPGFPTDMQAQFMALLTLADGTSHITETIYENRFMHVPELNRLSADILIQDHSAIINGVANLKGAEVMATDLRASVSLVIAALVAEGETVIDRVYHLDRGYENLELKLAACGAKIERLTDTATPSSPVLKVVNG